mmetsp:Transcript_13753/g.15217  ORF Transcript_13753/g.15217 Transcript_13753/m.15217 type:complete len:126 (-) Transcript_13753:400-777(-)
MCSSNEVCDVPSHHASAECVDEPQSGVVGAIILTAICCFGCYIGLAMYLLRRKRQFLKINKIQDDEEFIRAIEGSQDISLTPINPRSFAPGREPKRDCHTESEVIVDVPVGVCKEKYFQKSQTER